MKPKTSQKSKLSQPSEFIKMMVVIMVFVSVFLFGKGLYSGEQTIVNVVVLIILFFLLQLVFVVMFKKGFKTLAFWLLVLLGLLVVSIGFGTWYVFQFGVTLHN